MRSIRACTPKNKQILEFEEMNSALHAELVNTIFLQDWKTEHPRTNIEFIISPHCNLKCEYCYINKHGSELFPEHLVKPDVIRENLQKVLIWLGENDYHPSIDIFSGELFAQELGWNICEDIAEFYETHPYRRPLGIGIPTNYTFIDSQETIDRIEKLIERFNTMNIDFHLSASIDGLLIDELSRPIKNQVVRNQEWYDRCFAFIAKHGYGPHPMVAPSTVHKWKENFEWFMDMFEKHDMDWWQMYMLEVRDYNWTPQNLQDYQNLIYFMMDWMWDKVEHDPQEFFVKFGIKESPKGRAYTGTGFNMLRAALTNGTNSAACTIQKYFNIRLADLKTFPCHRTMYPHLETATLSFPENNICEIKSKNVELATAIYSFSPNKLPLCYKCEINQLCGTQCYGSQYEATGDLFNPIPTICQLNIVRINAVVDKLKEFGLYPEILSYMPREASVQLDRVAGGHIK